MRSWLRELRIDSLSAGTEVIVVQLETEAAERPVAGREIGTIDTYAVFVAVDSTFFSCGVTRKIGCSDTAVVPVVISGCGDAVGACEKRFTQLSAVFQRDVEVVALLGLEVGIAINHLNAGHVEIHIHLFEGRGAEPSGV